jgi:DNA helicase-2/ATP-dependent DNA helicase PcrA
MRFAADVHIHSRYSRACSKDLDLEHVAHWAQLKGIDVVGTGDFTHPKWFAELQEKLEPAEDGLFRLKNPPPDDAVPAACRKNVRFMLTVEISSIYKKGGRVRKVHNVVCAPSFDQALAIQKRLGKIGNIRSDGRPILGLDCRNLLEIVLEAGEGCFVIPAHIWTPHFSVLGAESGFDSIDECFGDLARHIFALETGLSSDPAMNRRVSRLDRFTLVSNSDAHSAPKLARECNLLDADLSYWGIRDAWKSGDPKRCLGTVEFFPEEGKYHLGGHRACGVRVTPQEARRNKGRCPTCGRKLTKGVLDRVDELADRPPGAKPERFRSLVPLPEILSEILGAGPESKTVQKRYREILARTGSELFVLLDADDLGDPELTEAIRRMRRGDVSVEPGYDGVYGKVSVLKARERALGRVNQSSLLQPLPNGSEGNDERAANA